MFFEFLMFWTRETISNIRRNRLMSVLAVSTVTIGLFILGAFFLTLANLRAIVKNETQKLDLVVFLKPEIRPRRRKLIYDAAHIPQVAKLEFVSKSQVLKEMQRDMPDIPIEDFKKNNPLGDELRIKLKDPYEIFKVRDYLNSMKGVQSKYTRTPSEDPVVRNLLALDRFMTVAGVAALFILGMAILLIIHNAIRLTIFSRRREIRIMELVGATLWFIRIPFLLEGMIYGMTGAVYAALVLSPLYAMAAHSTMPWVQMLLPLAHTAAMWRCAAGMLLAGLAFGLLGSWFSLARSLGKAAHI